MPGGYRDLLHPSVPQSADPIAWAVFTVRKYWPSLAVDWPDVDSGTLDKIRAKVYIELGTSRGTKERERLIGEFDERFAALTERNKMAPETQARSKRRTRAGRKKAS